MEHQFDHRCQRHDTSMIKRSINYLTPLYIKYYITLGYIYKTEGSIKVSDKNRKLLPRTDNIN